VRIPVKVATIPFYVATSLFLQIPAHNYTGGSFESTTHLEILFHTSFEAVNHFGFSRAPERRFCLRIWPFGNIQILS